MPLAARVPHETPAVRSSRRCGANTCCPAGSSSCSALSNRAITTRCSSRRSARSANANVRSVRRGSAQRSAPPRPLARSCPAGCRSGSGAGCRRSGRAGRHRHGMRGEAPGGHRRCVCHIFRRAGRDRGLRPAHGLFGFPAGICPRAAYGLAASFYLRTQPRRPAGAVPPRPCLRLPARSGIEASIVPWWRRCVPGCPWC